MTTLLALRIFGPCTTAELSRRVKLDRYTTILAAEGLVEQELATRSPGGLWDISPKGKVCIDLDLKIRRRASEVAAQATRRWPYQWGGHA